MQRAGPPSCAFSLLSYWLPIPFQCSPNWFPILRRRLHDYFFGLLLVAILPPSDFHKVSRAEGPKRTDGMRRPVSSGMRYAPNVRRAQGTKKETGNEAD